MIKFLKLRFSNSENLPIKPLSPGSESVLHGELQILLEQVLNRPPETSVALEILSDILSSEYRDDFWIPA